MEERIVIDLEKYLDDVENEETKKEKVKINTKFLIDKDRTFSDICKDIVIGVDEDRIKQALKYIETLHRDEEGIVFLAQKIKNGGEEFKQKAFRYNAIVAAIKNGTTNGDVGISGYGIDFNKDTYISVNSFYKHRRLTDNIKEIKAIQLEYDNHSSGFEMTDAIFNCVINLLEMDYLGIKVPYPTLIVRTGRGMQLIWRLDNCHDKRLQQKVAKSLFEELKEFDLFGLEMDAQVLDLARVFRLPGTMHTMTQSITEIYSNTGEIFELEDIIYGYCPELVDEEKNTMESKRKYTVKKTDRKVKYTDKHWNYYVLNSKRVEDLESLFKLRDGRFERCRNFFMHLYCYHLALVTQNKDYTMEKALEIDSKFSAQCDGSLGRNHVKHIINSTFEKAKRLLESKNKKDYNLKDVYRYTNDRIIDMLKITVEEQKKMKTIRSKEIYKGIHRKDCLNNYYKKRYEKIKNGEIVTKTSKIEDEVFKVKNLKGQGFKNKDIALALNISLSTVKRRLSN